MIKEIIAAFLSIPTGTWIKWIIVGSLLIFAGTWLTLTWLAVFGVGEIYAKNGGSFDRRETPFKFWCVIALFTAFGIVAIALALFVARIHFLPTPRRVDGPPMLP